MLPTTPRDSYTWNYREPENLLTLSESLAVDGFKPLTIGLIRKDLTAEVSHTVTRMFAGQWFADDFALVSH